MEMPKNILSELGIKIEFGLNDRQLHTQSRHQRKAVVHQDILSVLPLFCDKLI